MKQLVAIVLGFFSGLLIYFIAGALFVPTEPGRSVPVAFVFVTLLGGWALTTWVILRGARTVSKVFSRGFLVGAAEWLVMGLAGLVLAGRIAGSVTSHGPQSDAAVAGAAIGTGIGATLMGGFALFMTVACLVGFAVSYSLGREMKPEEAPAGARMKCPQCAELIQRDARKCRFCGSELVASVTPAR